jgi:O-antigen ligase
MDKKIFLLAIPLALGTSAIRWQEKELHRLFYCFLGACLVATVICLFHAWSETQIFLSGGTNATRIGYLSSSDFQKLNPGAGRPWLFFSYVALAKGVGLHPTYFSLYLGFCSLFLLYRLLVQPPGSSWWRGAMVLIMIFLSFFIVLLSSRIILVSLVGAYVIALLRFAWRQPLSLLLLPLILVVCALLYLNPVSRYRSLQEPVRTPLSIQQNGFYKNSMEIRASLWWLAWKTFQRTNPATGSGTGDVVEDMKETARTYNISNVLDTHYPHNEYLYLLIANGIAGLLIFILLLVIPAIQVWITGNYLYLGFSLLFGTLCFTDDALEWQKGIGFFALIYPLLVFHGRLYQAQAVTLKFSGAGN